MFLPKGMLRTLKGQSLAAALCALGLLCAGARAETTPKPATRLVLSDLGFPGYPQALLHAGASMATVHLLDKTHVLLTYSLRTLVPRLPGDDKTEAPREVAAVLLEVPSGKVLARTQWHLQDHSRYLWNAGGGVFVLRQGKQLSLFAPLLAVTEGRPAFDSIPLPHRPGAPVLLWSSPDNRILSVELESVLPEASGDDEGERQRKYYTIEFYRLLPSNSQHHPLKVEDAGVVGSPVPLRLAMDGDGYLWADNTGHGKWSVTFNEFGGKQEALTPVMSSCRPRLELLSRSQFLAQTCRGTEQQSMVSAYGFDGHENWEEPVGEELQPPVFTAAPEAGRFAVSRLAASSGGAPVNGLGSDNPLAQELRVYQVESGDLLLKLQCAPAMRSAENFDLSPDGTLLAMLSPETLDLYRLPELSTKDRKELAEVQTMTPPRGYGPVVLARIAHPIAAPESAAAETAGAVPGASPTASVASNASAETGAAPSQNTPAASVRAAAEAVPASDAGLVATSSEVRKPPTLLNPGEKAEFTVKSSEPR